MLSLSYKLSVADFKEKEIGAQTLVRVHFAALKIFITNDGPQPLRNIHVKPTVESYVGQVKPILFLSLNEEIVDEISPKSLVPVTFHLWPNFSGLVSIVVQITDSHNNAIMTKRPEEKEYKEAPVRWWFHVIENVPVEILRTLKEISSMIRNDMEKTKTAKPEEARK